MLYTTGEKSFSVIQVKKLQGHNGMKSFCVIFVSKTFNVIQVKKGFCVVQVKKLQCHNGMKSFCVIFVSKTFNVDAGEKGLLCQTGEKASVP